MKSSWGWGCFLAYPVSKGATVPPIIKPHHQKGATFWGASGMRVTQGVFNVVFIHKGRGNAHPRGTVRDVGSVPWHY